MSDKKCPNCGACKECGARPQVVPMPYPVYPYVPWSQPYQPWRPQRYPYTVWSQTMGAGSAVAPQNYSAGNYQ